VDNSRGIGVLRDDSRSLRHIQTQRRPRQDVFGKDIFSRARLLCRGDGLEDNFTRNSFMEQYGWETLQCKLFSHIYLFLIGMFFQQNFDFFYKHLHDRFPIFLIINLAVLFALKHFGIINSFGWQLLFYVSLPLCIFSLAYSYRGLSQKLLKSNDIS